MLCCCLRKVLMTSQTHNKPKFYSFSRIINFCNNLLSNYRNLCLKCDAGASFRERGLEGFTEPPKICDFSIFLCKSYLWNNVTAAKTIRYTDLDPQITVTLKDLLKWRTWHDAKANGGINDQLIKMHRTHSRIKCVLSLTISYFVVCCFQRKMFNIRKIIKCHGVFCGIDNAHVNNLDRNLLIITT